MSIDFYAQLYESLCDDNNSNEYSQNTSNICLISGIVLDDTNMIKLLCNHAFDYSCLLKEVYIRKHKVMCDVKIPRNCIQCPYCRNIQKGILPYREGFEKKVNVNYPTKYAMKSNTCNRILKNGNICGKLCVYTKCCTCENYERKPKCSYTLKRGKRKGEKCGKPHLSTNKYCSAHSVKMQTNANNG